MDITVEELRNKLESGEPFLFIDVREPWEYEEFNLGARLIPLQTLINNLFVIEDHRDDEIVVCCRSGGRSGIAQAVLSVQGFKNVRNLTGGIMAWFDAFGETKP